VGPDLGDVPHTPLGERVGGRVPLAFVLTGAMGVASFPIFALAALGPVVVAELDISRTQFGAVSTTMFGTAIVGSVLIGSAVDRVGARRVLVALFLCSTTAVGLVASAGSFARLLTAGVVVGLAQASANPATNSVVSHHVRVEHRGSLMGVKQAGVPLSQFIAGGVLAPVAVVIGWRAAVLLGLVLILPTLLATLVVLPPGTPVTAVGHGPRMGVPRGLAWLFVCTFLLATALQAANVYLPLYAFEEVGLSASTAGVLVGVVGAVGMVARILLGRVAGASLRPVRIVACIGVVATASVLGITAAAGGSHLLLWLGAVMFGASVFGVNVVGMTVIIRSVDPANAGRASGALSTVMFTGFALGPIGFGSLVDATDSYLVAWTLVGGLCALAGAVGLVAWGRAGWRAAS
jgi:predicted MFS family arabinose efflux permease